MPGIRGKSKYTFAVCKSIAEKCLTKADFMRKSPAAYAKSRKLGWLSCFTWFVNGKRRPKRLTYDVCEAAARQCNTLKQFYKEHYPEWCASKRHGWLDEFKWLKRAYHAEWTHDSCREEAGKYKTKKEFREGSSGAYSVARDNGWLDKEFTWLEDQTINIEYGRIYSVYRYEIELEGKKYEYVGLTMRPKERDRRHREQDSPVRNFAEAHNLQIPPMIIVEQGLTQAEARHKEDFYRRLFESSGYEMLNRGPTGDAIGSVGGMHRKWGKKACLAEAKKYRTKEGFRRANMGAYLACCRHKWMSECTWFVSVRVGRRKNTREYCELRAHQFKTFAEFRKSCPSVYQSAKSNGWMTDYTWLLHRGELPKGMQSRVVELYRKGRCLKSIECELNLKHGVAKRVIVSTIPTEYRGKRASVIDVQKVMQDLQAPWVGTKQGFAVSHGFPSTDSLSAFLKAHGVKMQIQRSRFSREVCCDMARKCKTRVEFKRRYSGAYARSCKEGWIKDYTWFTNGRIKWTLPACQEESRKYHTKTEFKSGCPTAYRVCCKNGWLSLIGPFEDGKKIRTYKWTIKSCAEEARKYAKISDFIHKALGAYKFAKRHDLLKTFRWFSEYVQRPRKWTKEKIFEASRNYHTRTEFNDGCGAAYQIASKNGWLSEMTWLRSSRR